MIRFGTEFKAARLEATSDGRPPFGGTDEDLALINADPRVAVALTAATCYVRRIYAINDQPLKNGLVLPLESVTAIARLAKGTPILCNHDKGSWSSGAGALPLGRVFKSELVNESGINWALLSVCFPASELTTEVVTRMDGGAISEASSSFYYVRIDCSICGCPFGRCEHAPMAEYDGKPALGRVIDPYEYLETSLVWQGMANGTHFKIAAARDDEDALLQKLSRRGATDPLAYLVDPAAANERRALESLFEIQ